ncbi:negative regulator of systemic acquired resistance SNI1-like isoform X2 [Musa acuminata AAA Group]|uniref:negative regulator of systemic acquired resistance SNI1-like isoform X2 n=1 Tax=Musa acuminata AAA Group TaxID=214697 RepID=UPI0031D1DEB7
MVNPNSKRGANSNGGGGREKSNNNSKNNMGAWEENTMAILDSSGFKDSQDVHDDRLCFLEAVRSASLASEPSTAPSWRMFDAVFQILVDCNSLELTMASYQLLTELDKRYSRVYVMKSDKTESSSSGIVNLVVVKEAWSPFNLASDGERTAKDLCSLFDSVRFSTLIEDMVQAVNKLSFDLVIKAVGNLLLFQYLVNVLEDDLLPRLTVYKETLNWLLLKESVLNILLVMELDVARKEADMHGLTSRLDGFRLPILEIIVDELTYNRDSLPPFLVVFSEPKWKLEIILQYFSKYITKSSVRTRRSNEKSDGATLRGMLNGFSTAANTKNIVKRVTSGAAQLLLAHAFQACLSLVRDSKQIASSTERIGATLSEICNSLISAFRNLRKTDEGLEITSFAKEALFAAAIVLKRKP